MPSVHDKFKLVTDFQLAGDQARSIPELVEGLQRGDKNQVLLGVTGSGKTFTMAKVIETVNRPTLVMVHNKTLAAQLYQEFRRFFPENAVEYFVSYYDYYQPEAYVPSTDSYIEKEATINEEIDRMRLSATRSLFERGYFFLKLNNISSKRQTRPYSQQCPCKMRERKGPVHGHPSWRFSRRQWGKPSAVLRLTFQ